MRKGLILVLPALLLPLALLAQTPADDTLYVQVEPGADTVTTILGSDQAHIKKVVYWYPSPGNLSEMIDLYLEAPPLTIATVKAAPRGALSNEAVLADATLWRSLSFRTINGKERSSLLFRPRDILLDARAPATAAAMTDCSKLTQDQIDALLNLLSTPAGRPVTEEELCGDGSGDDGDGNDDPVYGQDNVSKSVKSLFSKDTCLAKKKSKYLAAVEFDLSAIDAAAYKGGVTLAITLTRYVYKGDKSASIKPISDGRYAPRPIILMASLGGYGNETIRLVRWKRGKIAAAKKIKVGKYTYHFGHIYSVGLLDTKYLRGGKGVFEISNGYEAYSVCFNLKRTRQKVNGYP